jgi:CubicO group peptidase (beta-lactamase class C family)
VNYAQASPAGKAEAQFDKVRAQLNQVVPELMEQYQVPGVAIAVVDADGPVHMAGYGDTDESKPGRIQHTTVFEGASLGKPLFAYTILHDRAGRPFEPGRPVADYLGAPFVSEPQGAVITGRHFLSHSSGLVFSEAEGRRYLAFAPGSQWQYSGLGFDILQQAVEKLWNEALQELVYQTVTGPLKMESTSYLPPQRGTVTLASGHDRQGNQLPPTAWSSPRAASSLHTNVRDYGRFLSAMLAELLSNRDSPAAQMIETQVVVDDAVHLSWGLGWAVAQEQSDTVFLQWGSNPGYKSLALGSLQQKIGMVVLTNGDNGLEIATALAPIVFGHNYSFLNFYMLHPDD